MSSQIDEIIYFKGLLHFDNISELIQVFKSKIHPQKVSYAVYKKILILMIELLENIIRYRENYENNPYIIEKSPPEFKISRNQNVFYIESSNAILNADVETLEKRLEEINSLDRAKIRELYKATITDGKFSEKGGAGLGIIEMAKMSDEKLIYSFSNIDQKFSSYNLKLIVRNQEIYKI